MFYKKLMIVLGLFLICLMPLKSFAQEQEAPQSIFNEDIKAKLLEQSPMTNAEFKKMIGWYKNFNSQDSSEAVVKKLGIEYERLMYLMLKMGFGYAIIEGTKEQQAFFNNVEEAFKPTKEELAIMRKNRKDLVSVESFLKPGIDQLYENEIQFKK